jgi:hypothetical protein
MAPTDQPMLRCKGRRLDGRRLASFGPEQFFPQRIARNGRNTRLSPMRLKMSTQCSTGVRATIPSRIPDFPSCLKCVRTLFVLA